MKSTLVRATGKIIVLFILIFVVIEKELIAKNYEKLIEIINQI